MENPDKKEPKTKNNYDPATSVEQIHPASDDVGEQLKEGEQMDEHESRNPIVKETESQGGVSDSLKGSEH